MEQITLTMEEAIELIVSQYEDIAHYVDYMSASGSETVFKEIYTYAFDDGHIEVSFEGVSVSRNAISIPIDSTGESLTRIGQKVLDILKDSPLSNVDFIDFKRAKSARKRLDAKIAGMRKGNNET